VRLGPYVEAAVSEPVGLNVPFAGS
jgi:hypothetical protein